VLVLVLVIVIVIVIEVDGLEIVDVVDDWDFV
jgi:hypothetical protein